METTPGCNPRGQSGTPPDVKNPGGQGSNPSSSANQLYHIGQLIPPSQSLFPSVNGLKDDLHIPLIPLPSVATQMSRMISE